MNFDFEAKNESAVVFRLVSILDDPVDTLISELGIDIEESEKTVQDLDSQGFLPPAKTADELCDDSFIPSQYYTTPYPLSRFGDGEFGVFYSALEKETCQREIAYHYLEDCEETTNDPRKFCLLKCSFKGSSSDLRGKEEAYPDLVSSSDDGYPFCRRLAKLGKLNDIKCFFTLSARRVEGTCVPIFERTAIRYVRKIASCKLRFIHNDASFIYS